MIDEPSAALDLLDVQVWSVYWAPVERRIGSVFARSDARTRAMTDLAGLLCPAERKNSWQLAEISGDPTPYGLQHVLGRADWDPDTLRDRLRTYGTDDLAAPDAVGGIDERGLRKKGTHAAGVARQYRGTAGRVEHRHIGVFLAYARGHGHPLLDRELYVPQEWIDDRDRCRRAGLPDARAVVTNPALARQRLERACEAGVVLAWVTGDRVSGDTRTLRAWREARAQAYVLAVSGNATIWLNQVQRQITTLLTNLPRAGWERLSAGAGAQGARRSAWLRREVRAPAQPGWKRWRLLRRSSSDPSAVPGDSAFARADPPRSARVRVAGTRWTVEERSQTAKGAVGLDQYEVRSWTGW